MPRAYIDIDDPDLPLADLFRDWPEAMRPFLERRMLCPGCPIAPFHTVIDAVEAGLEQIGATLPPARKAKLVASLYGIYQSGDDARRAPVMELVRLAV